MERIAAHVARLLATAEEGRLLRDGITLALCGAPNAGKSSLLNRLLGMERAIVSATPGTTRDTIEERASLGGYPFCVIDTAGLRETTDPVEHEGVMRARHAAEQADLCLHLIDATMLESGVTPLFEHELLVLNKVDLLADRSALPPALTISCHTGEGMEALVAAILAHVIGQTEAEAPHDGITINTRHQDCLHRAAVALATAITLLKSGEPPELVALELRASLFAVGEIIGEAGTEEILGKIFSSFCIGK
jgi:tRNA modification GTPase